MRWLREVVPVALVWVLLALAVIDTAVHAVLVAQRRRWAARLRTEFSHPPA